MRCQDSLEVINYSPPRLLGETLWVPGSAALFLLEVEVADFADPPGVLPLNVPDFMGFVGLGLSLTFFVLLTDIDAATLAASSAALADARLISAIAASLAFSDCFNRVMFYRKRWSGAKLVQSKSHIDKCTIRSDKYIQVRNSLLLIQHRISLIRLLQLIVS